MKFKIFDYDSYIPQQYLRALYFLEHKYYPNIKEDEYFCIKIDDEYYIDMEFSEIVFFIRDKRVVGYYIVIYSGKNIFKSIVKEHIKNVKIYGKRFCVICDFVIEKEFAIYAVRIYNTLLSKGGVDMFFANYKKDTSYSIYKKYLERKIFCEKYRSDNDDGFINVVFTLI